MINNIRTCSDARWFCNKLPKSEKLINICEMFGVAIQGDTFFHCKIAICIAEENYFLFFLVQRKIELVQAC